MYILTVDIFLNPLVTAVVAHDNALNSSQILYCAHLLFAIAPVGPFGHDILAVLFIGVSGQAKTPR